MEAIKHIIRTPKDHEIRIRIPEHIPENDPVEIILFYRKTNDQYDKKIIELEKAIKDTLFTNDLDQISKDFENIDNENWPE